MVDLHAHSTESDGTLSPEELILLSRDVGLSAVALTDHDTVRGLREARDAAERIGMEFVPGIEFSTHVPGHEIHILGYYMDDTDPAFLAKLDEIVRSRDVRNEKMASLLRKEGFDVTMGRLYEEYPGSVITRAHFARYLVEHGFVRDREAVFREYLGNGCRCYVPRERLSPPEAIRLIRSAGGLAFFAHPVLCHMGEGELEQYVTEWEKEGLSGIEAIYPLNGEGDEAMLSSLAARHGLLISGGSDFHGANKPGIRLGTGLGNLCVPDEVFFSIRRHAKHPA